MEFESDKSYLAIKIIPPKYMSTPYKYISSIDYLADLTYDYIETYSFQRGPDYEQYLESIKPEYEKLEVRKAKRNNLTDAEEARFAELQALLGFTQYLVNDKGEFHPSSKKITTVQKGDPIVERLSNILKTEIKETPMTLCAPTYRDAIVFYNNSSEIVSVLNVCLSCYYMETKMFNHINGDFETYDLLKRFFIDIGHNVENPTEFVMDEINKLKEKYKPKRS